ncbi:head scaffolding protein [Pseudomonas phage PspYZU05]|uniref:Prohead core scaffold protein n=1 Tax=Pseudomonas phage PspYZU05 TaxID=1983556 RepID=A0A2U7NN24_9CAUD|nr:head scaffolding protein [Pseudomonas phage PspYZU05]ASD52087.1 prohead core scaffold protein [Pseudomonas phage PspYZU05]
MKELLLKEAANLEIEVKVDELFESTQVSAEFKNDFAEVYQASVRAQAVKLAEAHIEKIADLAETKLAEGVEEAQRLSEENLTKKANAFFDHLSEEWLKENKLPVENSIKARLFESMVVGMKELFVEHNIVVPEESVDVVSELEDELTESRAEVANLFGATTALKEELSALKRTTFIKEATLDLTDSQKEKVLSLTEGIPFAEGDSAYGSKVTAIIEMVKGSKTAIVENKEDTQLDEGLNYQETEHKEEPKGSSLMSSYVKSAVRLS